MGNFTMKGFSYQIGKLCRLTSRKVKLMAISSRRKQQLRHLGERVYIFKALQQDEDIWEKDEIAQLLLTIADLDQEQEMIIDEINEIKAETPPADSGCSCRSEDFTSPTANPQESSTTLADSPPASEDNASTTTGASEEKPDTGTTPRAKSTKSRGASKKTATDKKEEPAKA
ncbi:MAG: hypothetical protein JXR89_00205 [Deltaproteobacteria bacterium]|nr:hypothetical protein [Deltaproteobacteria bacterium]